MLKNLKSLFIKEEEVSESTSEKKSSTEGSKTESGAKTSPSTPPPIPSKFKPVSQSNSVGSVNPKIIEKLLAAIEAKNLEGFDYFEYKKSLKALEKLQMDEATKYRSAFATASTMGVTLDIIIDSSKFYLGVIDEEHKKFLAAFKSEFTDKVANKRGEITQYEKGIQEKSAQIKKLTEEIAMHQEHIASLKIQVSDNDNKIKKTQNDFKSSYEHIKATFEEDIQKMNQYLK